MHVCILHNPHTAVWPQNKNIQESQSQKKGLIREEPLHNSYITYVMNKVVQLPIFMLFENDMKCWSAPDSSCLCDVIDPFKRGPY